MSQNDEYFNRRSVTKRQNVVVIVHEYLIDVEEYVTSLYLNVEAAYIT